MTRRRRTAFEIEWARPARRALARIPEKVATAAIEFIYGAMADNPHRVGHPLRFELEGRHSASRGDFRIIYRIDEGERFVFILTIEHRADVYRRR
ncbi:MAG TPA: type II toxin-antitoxin system RelE/ParE family toxin [Actinomycetota bacterium]